MSDFENDFQEAQSPKMMPSESSDPSAYMMTGRTSEQMSQYDNSYEQKQQTIEFKPEIIITEPDLQISTNQNKLNNDKLPPINQKQTGERLKKIEPIEEEEISHEQSYKKKPPSGTRSKKSGESRSIKQSQSEEFKGSTDRKNSTPKFSERIHKLQTPKTQQNISRTNSSEKSEIRSEYKIDQQKYLEDMSAAQNLFTDEEIEEAFRSFDLDKNNYITINEVLFALECLGEYASEEEATEMIHMLDKEGHGRVYYPEFYKMATGQSLAPIGAALPPSPEMQPTESFRMKQKSSRQNEVRVSERQQQSQMTPQVAKDKSAFQRPSIRKVQSSETETQQEVTNQEQIAQQIETDVRAHQTAEDAILEEFIVTTQLQKEVLEKLLKKFYQLQKKDELSYEQFCIIAKLQDSSFSKAIFKYIDKDSNNALNLKEFIFGMAKIIKGSKDDKIRFAFAIFDEDMDGQITKEELVKVLRSKFTHAEAIRKSDQFCAKINAKTINLEHFTQLAEEFPLVLAPLHSVVNKLNALIF